MNVEEWLKLGFMSEIRLELQLKQGLDRQEILNNADITIKATMNDITVSDVVAAEDIHRYGLQNKAPYYGHTPVQKFCMNWGWNGDSDGYFGVAPEEWDTSNYDAYQYNADILYNFELMED